MAQFVKTVQEGASTQVYLASSNDVVSNAGKVLLGWEINVC